MIEVVNRQRKMPIDCERWQAFATKAVKVVAECRPRVSRRFCFRSSNAQNSIGCGATSSGTTDVLSFPAEQDEFEKTEGTRLGDVVISVEQAARQAKENGLTLDQEIAQLILARPDSSLWLRSCYRRRRDESAGTAAAEEAWHLEKKEIFHISFHISHLSLAKFAKAVAILVRTQPSILWRVL